MVTETCKLCCCVPQDSSRKISRETFSTKIYKIKHQIKYEKSGFTQNPQAIVSNALTTLAHTGNATKD